MLLLLGIKGDGEVTFIKQLLLLPPVVVLSRFSRVRLCATP